MYIQVSVDIIALTSGEVGRTLVSCSALLIVLAVMYELEVICGIEWRMQRYKLPRHMCLSFTDVLCDCQPRPVVKCGCLCGGGSAFYPWSVILKDVSTDESTIIRSKWPAVHGPGHVNGQLALPGFGGRVGTGH